MILLQFWQYDMWRVQEILSCQRQLWKLMNESGQLKLQKEAETRGAKADVLPWIKVIESKQQRKLANDETSEDARMTINARQY